MFKIFNLPILLATFAATFYTTTAWLNPAALTDLRAQGCAYAPHVQPLIQPYLQLASSAGLPISMETICPAPNN